MDGGKGRVMEADETDPLLISRISNLQEEDEISARGQSNGTGDVATFFNFAKSSIGSGSFALSWGILQAGVLVGLSGMVFIGIASVYTMQLMLKIKGHIQRKVPSVKRNSLSYTEIGYIAMGVFGKWAVNIAVLGCNLGVCAGYMIFISTNMQWVFNCISVRTHDFICFSTWEVYILLLPILIILTFLPSFKFLAYPAGIGFLFLGVAMLVVYAYGINSHIFCAVDGINGLMRYLPESFAGVAQWFGVTAFLFCVHSMVIPLESAMKKPRNMPVILDIAALLVVGINLPFAVYGYLLFGSNTQGYILSNLPGDWFNTTVRAFLCFQLVLTFPIVIKPASDVMEEIWKNVLMFFSIKFDIRKIMELYESRKFGYVAARTAMVFTLRGFLVLFSWIVAVSIPRFELCLALVGSLTTTVLAFVLPPLFHLKVRWNTISPANRVFHIVFLLVGICVTVLATSINLYMAVVGSSRTRTCEDFKKMCTQAFINDTDHCFAIIE